MALSNIAELRQEINRCEVELEDLRRQLREVEKQQKDQEAVFTGNESALAHQKKNNEVLSVGRTTSHSVEETLNQDSESSKSSHVPEETKWPLKQHEYKRYGRQLIMPEIGLQGTEML